MDNIRTIAYHVVGMESNNVEGIINKIIKGGFKMV